MSGQWLTRTERPPAYPYIPAWDSHGLPCYFRFMETTNRFQAEFCPHKDQWASLSTAKAIVPPCQLYMARQRKQGCPTGKEMQCALYTMGRTVGRSPDKARSTTLQDVVGKL